MREYRKNNIVVEIVSGWFEGRILVFFGSRGGVVLIFAALGTDLEIECFCKVTLGILIGTIE